MGSGVRFIQLTPPGSPASISIGSGLSSMTPGSSKGCASSSTTSRPHAPSFAGRGVDVSDVHVFDWGSFVFFSDPDGNGWAVQQLPDRP